MDGYKIIDFKGIDLADSPTIPGIFNAIDESNKPLVFSNIVLSGYSAKPFFVGNYGKAEDSYRIPLADGYSIYVADDDSVIYQAD